eukprot:TRINITY_DN15022_c0_g1_i1.p1 TRINITY_DN15022_c0_g1~~TRINITY_DN15022_c0_g1_i1.p1  ORF type:complete len:400 (-),score=46.77 TRINITY_DN15022_c0_g1_i1:31-1230(-)
MVLNVYVIFGFFVFFIIAVILYISQKNDKNTTPIQIEVEPKIQKEASLSPTARKPVEKIKSKRIVRNKRSSDIKPKPAITDSFKKKRLSVSGSSLLSASLFETKLSLVLSKSKRVLQANADSYLPKVYKRLIKHGVFTMPIYERKSGKKNYIGFVGVVDILHHALAVLSDVEMKADFSTFSAKEIFANKTAREVSNLSKRNMFIVMSTESTIGDAVDHFLAHNVHQILLQIDDRPYGILTQRILVHYLAPFAKYLRIGNKTLDELKLGYREVYTVGVDSQFGDAFRIMKDKNLTAVAVVSTKDPKYIIEEISVSDLKLVGYDAHLFHKLSQPIRLLLENLKVTKQTGLVTVTPKNTINEVLSKFTLSEITRVYIVEQGTKHLIGVITLSDVIRLFEALK